MRGQCMHPNPNRQRPLARAVALALGLCVIQPATVGVLAAEPGQVQRQRFDVPAGPLSAALRALAGQAGVALTFTPDQTDGRSSPGLHGQYSLGEAFAALLAAHDLQAVRQANGGYALRPVIRVSGGDEATLRPVLVSASTAQTATGPVDGYLATRALTASKTDTPVLETARSISVVTADQIRDRGALSVENAVAYTAGVQVAAWGDDPRFDQITIRGFETTTTADYRDGLRQPYAGWLSCFRTEPYGLERLEIVKGPNSVLFGQISPGGMINRVSKRPTRESIREVEIQAGSNNHYQLQADLGGQLGEGSDWSWRLTGLARNADSDTLGVNDDSLYIAPALTWQPSAATRVTFLAHAEHYETAGSPRPFQYPSGKLSRFWPGDVDFDGLKQDQFTLGYEAEHRFNDVLTLRQNLRYGQVDTDNQYTDASLDVDGDTILRSAVGVYEKMHSLNVDTSLAANFTTGPLQHKLIAGIDYLELDSDVRYMSGPAPSISLSNPDHNQPIAKPTTVWSDLGISASQTGVYAQDQASLGNWRLSLGLRRDRAEQAQKDRLAGSTQRQTDRKTSGSVGLLYLVNDQLAPYVSYATSFTPQFGSNVGGSPYKPTVGKQVEAGIKYQPAGSKLLLTASVFNLVQQNALTRDLSDPAGINKIQTGETRSRGVELEATGKLLERLELVAAYTRQDVEVTRSNDGNQGKQPVGLPEQLASLWARYRFASGLSLGLGARWTGKTWADGANTLRNDGYTQVDANLGYDIGRWLPGASVALKATNLTDEQYLMCHDGYCYRGRGRSLVASLNYRW